MAAVHRYLLHGVSLASEIALADVPEVACGALGAAVPQVCIERGIVPAALPGVLVQRGQRLQWNGTRLLVTAPGTARFLVSSDTICVDPVPDADPEMLQVLLLGSVWAACCHLRGQLLLHASAARIGASCVVFLGNSGAGKSTLAALLAARGHRIAADDTCVLTSTPGATHLQPGARSIKLWRDALPLLASNAADVRAAPRQPGKFKLSIRTGWLDRPQPVQHLLVLDSDAGGTAAGFQRLPALSALRSMVEHTFRPGILAVLGRRQQNFLACASVSATTEVHRWVRPWGGEQHQRMVEMLEEWLQSHAPAHAARPVGLGASLQLL